MSIKVYITTVTGSIMGDSMKPVCVDDSITVHKFKMFVQDHVEHTPLVQRGNPNMKILKGVSPDFQRLFLDNVELENDSKTLQECGVKQGSMLSFAVRKMLGNKLRRAILGLEDAPMSFSVVGDCEILASVLENLKDRTLDPDKREGSLRDALYGVFNPNFDKIEGVHDGCLTLNKERGEEKSSYIHWAVDEEIKGACPFKTYYGIPVYPRVYTRQKQHLVGEPQPGSLVVYSPGGSRYGTGAHGHFGQDGKLMACTAHFAGAEGNPVHKNTTDTHSVGSTVLSIPEEDFAVVAMDVDCVTTGPITTSE